MKTDVSKSRVVTSVLLLIIKISSCLPSLSGTTFEVDVGSAGDLTPGSGPCFGYVTGGTASPPQVDVVANLTYRTITEAARLVLSCDVTGFDTSVIGVPFVDAFFLVSYRDDVNGSSCVPPTSWYGCLDRGQVRLDRGSISWYNVLGLAGLADGQWKTASIPIAKSPFQLLRAINGSLSVAVYNAKQPGGAVPLAVDKITLRFVGAAQMNSEREAWRAANGLLRSEYLNGTAETEAPPSAGSLFAVYVRSTLQKIWPNTVPNATEIASPKISAIEVRGETESATFSLYAFVAISGVRVTVSGLDPSVAQAKIFEVLVEDRRWTWAYDKFYGRNPWSLRPLTFPCNDSTLALGNWARTWPGSISVDAGTSKQFWINFEVPRTSPPGVHPAVVDVCATPTAGGPESCKSIPVSLTVIDVTLGVPDTNTFVYHSPWLKAIYSGDEHEHVVRDQAIHGPLAPVVYARGNILGNGTVDFKLMRQELASLAAAGILQLGGKLRLLNSDNWGSIWFQKYGNYNYLQGRNETAAFDDAFKSVLRQYDALAAEFGTTIDNSFQDEPGIDPSRRRIANHLNRLAKEVGQSTWVTYYSNCERPLAGHDFVFTAGSAALPQRKSPIPNWVKADPALRVLYDFEQPDGLRNVTDRSSHGNHAKLYGASSVTGGVLRTPEGTYAYTSNSTSLNLPTGATILLSMRLFNHTTGYASRFATKWKGTSDANWCMYLFGSMYPETVGSLGAYVTLADGTWSGVPGQDLLLRFPANSEWHQFLWTFDSKSGGSMFLDHLYSFKAVSKNLSTSKAGMVLGTANSEIDDFVVLGRALTIEEQASLTEPEPSFFTTATLTTVVPSSVSVPLSIHFGLTDFDLGMPEFCAKVSLIVNGIELWSKTGQDLENEFFTINIASALHGAGSNNITFAIRNGRTSSDHLQIYFIDSFWRNSVSWAAGNLGVVWLYTHTPDPLGDLGPMHVFLDDAVSALRYVEDFRFQDVRSLGMKTSYYTTYHANTPTPIYNRFLDGLYASVVNAPTVNVYAYGDWTDDPWDEQSGRSTDVLNPPGQRFQTSYGLMQNSWDTMVYDATVWETLREGIEDSRLIRLLKDTVAKYPGLSKSKEAEAWLTGILSRPNKDYGTTYFVTRSNTPIERRGDTSDLILRDLCGSETDFGCFDRLRAQMVDFVQAIQGQASEESQQVISASATFGVAFTTIVCVIFFW